jgi:hypothetical protein
MRFLSTFLFVMFAASSLAGGGLLGCASSSDMRTSTEPEGPREKSRAHPAAYGVADTFTFGKPQKIRPANDFKFYFKECEPTDPQNDRAFFSKTAYSCTGVR